MAVPSSSPQPLPEPLRRYRTLLSARPPPELDSWIFRTSQPPYVRWAHLEAVEHLEPPPSRKEVPAGLILLGIAAGIYPNGHVREVEWLRRRFPWLALAVAAPPTARADAFDGLLTRLARHGAVVIHDHEAAPQDVGRVILDAFEPAVDLPRWLGNVVPGWRGATRARAIRSFLDGFAQAPGKEAARHAASHGPLWTRVGRAFRVVVAVQGRQVDGTSLSRFALEAGYHDFHSMERALHRLFGLFARDVRGTVGWEWLLWRFLNGMGAGKEQKWDR